MYEKIPTEDPSRYTLECEGVQGNRNVTEDYVVVSPDIITAKLENEGFHVERFRDLLDGSRWSLRHKKRTNPTLQALVVHCGGGEREGVRTVAILLPHTGDCAIKLVANVIRPVCTNMFPAFKGLRIRHDSWQAELFLSDPGKYVRDVLRDNDRIEDALDFARCVRIDENMLLNSLALARPKVATKLYQAMAYTPEARHTLWHVLQGLTEVKQRTWQEATRQLLHLSGTKAILAGPQEIVTNILLDI